MTKNGFFSMIKRSAILALLALSYVQANASLSYTFVPNTTSGASGFQTFDIVANDAVDLYAYQFSIKFDPTLFRAVDVTEGNFLPSGGSTLFSSGTIDNTSGEVEFALGTLLGPTPGVNGAGDLASIVFESIGVGSSALSLFDVFAIDSLGNVQDVETPSLNVSVVPEPSTVVLLLIGLGALSWRGRRRV